jgi:hypothetical protein
MQHPRDVEAELRIGDDVREPRSQLWGRDQRRRHALDPMAHRRGERRDPVGIQSERMRRIGLADQRGVQRHGRAYGRTTDTRVPLAVVSRSPDSQHPITLRT